MKLLKRRESPQEAEPTSVVPLFGPSDDEALTPSQRRTMMKPIIGGSVLIGVFVVGLLVWAGVSSLSGAVLAQGVVRAEANRKTLKSLEGGVVRAIHVRNGARVAPGQLLMQFDDVQPRAQVDILSGQMDSLLAQRARFEAEMTNRPSITFPPELLARAGEPTIAALMSDQQNLFQSRLLVLRSQADGLRQQAIQLESRVGGLQSQIASLDSQKALIQEELAGMQALFEKGYAPKTRILALQRAAAQIGGQRGVQVAEVSRAREAISETRIKLATLQQERVSEAAEAYRNAQTEIAEVAPRLRAARDALAHTRVTSPTDGYVLNLTQFTIGGVAAPGEPLLDIVPANAPLIIDAQVKPTDIEAVAPGMDARVRLSAYSSRVAPQVAAEVTTVGADRVVVERTGEAFFPVELRIKPDELSKFNGKVKLSPGQPADVMITTGERTVLDYLLGPLKDVFSSSMREE